MAHSAASGSRCPSPTAAGSTTTASAAARPTNASNGVRAVPAHYGGRHHLGAGAAPLSAMLPTKPFGLNAAAKQYGGRHHYGAEIERQMAAEASSPDNVAQAVADAMFGGLDDEEALFAEAEALLDEADED